ncbi:hypothetical protein H4Q26_001817 [Puccinia striiformis f. sp. tritici PST-130]|nr:hypothetical protein H4Q26_001817 [Puccinia striiformis f. sp. tritici PST-130]
MSFPPLKTAILAVSYVTNRFSRFFGHTKVTFSAGSTNPKIRELRFLSPGLSIVSSNDNEQNKNVGSYVTKITPDIVTMLTYVNLLVNCASWPSKGDPNDQKHQKFLKNLNEFVNLLK